MLLAMLMAAGLAVDTMRHERERVRMRATLDRAVLAASDLEQRLDPKQAVRDHFPAAGILDELDTVSVEQTLNSREVTADASLTLRAVFLDLVGVDTLRAAVDPTTEESVSVVEISLAPDASNSMEDPGTLRMQNMRIAATEFIETAMPKAVAPANRAITTINLVPYATSANIGPEMMALHNVDPVHDVSNCVLLNDDDCDALALATTRPLKQCEHFDPSNGRLTGSRPTAKETPLCPRAGINPMIPLGTDPRTLTRAIGELVVAGSTEMDAGMRWRIAMLDPQSRSLINALIAARRAGSDRPRPIVRSTAGWIGRSRWRC